MEVLTVKEMSKLLRVSDKTIYNLVKADKIPHFKVGEQQGRVLFRAKSIEKWILENETGGKQ